MKKWFRHKNIFIKFLIIGWSSILLIVLPSFLIMSYFLNKTERADQIHTMTDSIIIQMLNARIAEKSFILRDLHDEKFYSAGFSNNLQAHQRFTKNAQDKIEHLIEWRPVNGKNSADRLMQQVKEYSNIFSQLVETYQKIGFKDWGVLGQSRSAIHAVEAQITGMNRTDLQESLLQLRRLEKDYLLRGDEKYLQDIRNQIAGLREAVIKIPKSKATKISENLTLYENAFQKFVTLQKKVGRTDEEGLQSQFQKVIARMETVVDQIMAESKLDYEKAKQDFRLMSLIIYLVGIAVGSTFYFFFARSVSMKLIALKDGVLRVGMGNLDTTVPVTTNDEIGIVAEAFNKMTVDLKAVTVSKNYVDKIIESMADMLIVVNSEGIIAKVNRATLDLLGYEERKLIGKKIDLIFNDTKTDHIFLDEIIRTKSVRNFETELVGKDTQRIFVSLSGSLISDSVEIVCVAQDNTERKRAEKMLRKSAKELRLLSSRILEAQESERKRVARELHDGIGQALTGIKFALENGVRRLKETETEPHFKVLDDIIPLIQMTIDETRRIAMGLRPSTLDDIGISETIYWFCQQYENIYKNMRILKLIAVEEDQIPETLKTVIFRVLQESLNNVAKHSEADRVQLSLQQQDNTVTLIVEDNGGGFDTEKPLPQDASERGFGLASMRERIELSGGIFTLQSAPGQGTRISALWPSVKG
ncbi:MAG: PAS domain S-box protein [Desulfobacterales bacterium]